MNKVVILSFSQKGRALANRIAMLYPQSVFIQDYKEKSLGEHVETWFQPHNLLIFVGATGIAVRGIAPYIRGKDVDPAVLSVDELGNYVIPLLSGHLGGANGYAQELATFLGGTPVVTTATDINQVFAVDVWTKEQKLYIHNIDHIKYISSAILAREKVGMVSDYSLEGELPQVEVIQRGQENLFQSGILISEFYTPVFPHTLWVEPKKYSLGVGCRKNMEPAKFEEQLLELLKKHGIPIHLIGTIASIDLKAKEEAIVAFARKYGIEFLTYSAEELAAVTGEFSKSEFVQSVTGVDNVCERSARLVSGAKELYLKKTISSGMTMAVSIKEYKVRM